MANKTHDRTIINVRERPLSSDHNQEASQLDRTLRDLMRLLMTPPGAAPISGFLSDSFKVTQSAVPAMSVLLTAGLGYVDAPSDTPSGIGGVISLDDLSPYKPLILMEAQAVTVDAAPVAGQNRIDIIEVKVDRRAENPLSRDVLDANPLSTTYGQFVPNTVNKTLSFVLDGRTGRVVTPAASTTGIGYKVGASAPAGTEVAPATSPGYTKIAEVHVAGAVATIVNANLTDSRTVLPTASAFTSVPHTWTAAQTLQALLSLGGDVNLTAAVAQYILKTAAGGFGIGTAAGGGDFDLAANGVILLRLLGATPGINAMGTVVGNLGAPVAVGDALSKTPVSWTALTIDPAAWGNGGGGNSAGAYKDPAGIVHLRGALTATATPSSTITTLPVGMRPLASRVMNAVDYSAQVALPVIVSNTGLVFTFNPITTLHQLWLEGVSFPAEP